jgi:sRNA-binding carbon storage regulator CsrA
MEEANGRMLMRRRCDQSIRIREARITIQSISVIGGAVKLCFEAPKSVSIEKVCPEKPYDRRG